MAESLPVLLSKIFPMIGYVPFAVWIRVYSLRLTNLQKRTESVLLSKMLSGFFIITKKPPITLAACCYSVSGCCSVSVSSGAVSSCVFTSSALRTIQRGVCWSVWSAGYPQILVLQCIRQVLTVFTQNGGGYIICVNDYDIMSAQMF